MNEVKKNENFLFARIDYKKNRPQIDVKINKDKISDLGISSFEIGRTLELLLAGRKVNTYIENGEEYYVILQSVKEQRTSSSDIGSFEVKTPDGKFVRLENLLKFNEINEAKELNRYNILLLLW